MLAKINSLGLSGINGYELQIEVDAGAGMPGVDIVGLPDLAVKESRERVRSAVKSLGFSFPPKKIIINLAPADIKKEGAMYDLPIALGVLRATGQFDAQFFNDKSDVNFKNTVIVGELSLDGQLRRVKGVLPLIIAARSLGIKNIIIPQLNAKEASFTDGVNVYAFSSLKEVLDFLSGKSLCAPLEKGDISGALKKGVSGNDFGYVKGQYAAKRALEIAAAGNHNILLIGPPGGGKTMLAKCLPSILPDLTVFEAMETTKIHSVNGSLDESAGIVTSRPFRAPHHTCSRISLTGGGPLAKPGEISLAHNGVLFLDELPEYGRAALEILRQPLEDNVIAISRALRNVEYPANFMLVASMNPCPCGNYGSNKECLCTASQRSKYLSRLSGPLMDRIDIHIEADGVTYAELSDKTLAERSEKIKERVNEARLMQLKRFENCGIFSNARMSNEMIEGFCRLDSRSEGILQSAFERLGLSARAYTRILKVARTIADLDKSEAVTSEHISEAIGYRALDRAIT